MLNPLTTLIVQDITDNIDSDVVTGLVTSNEMSITGLVGSDDILLSALVKADSTIFLDLDAYSYLKQDAYDPRINGEDKTVVGAINNLIQAVKDINVSISNLDNNKLDKVTTKGTEDVYVSDINGNQITIVCTVETEPNTIVKRTSTGAILVPNKPASPQEATSKAYVDSQDAVILKAAKDYTDEIIVEKIGIQYEEI